MKWMEYEDLLFDVVQKDNYIQSINTQLKSICHNCGGNAHQKIVQELSLGCGFTFQLRCCRICLQFPVCLTQEAGRKPWINIWTHICIHSDMSKNGLTWLLKIQSFSLASVRMWVKPWCRRSIFHCFGRISTLCVVSSCLCHRVVLHKLPLLKFSFPAWPNPMETALFGHPKMPKFQWKESSHLPNLILIWNYFALH